MARQLGILLWLPRDLGRAYVVLALSAIVAALAAMMIPGPASEATGIAAVLAVGGIALVAGHRWASLVVGAAAILLIGKIWPMVFMVPRLPGHEAATVTFIAALPSLAVFFWTIPRTVKLVVGSRGPRAQSTGVAFASIASAVWLLLPAL